MYWVGAIILATAAAGREEQSEYQRACARYVPGAGIDKFTPYDKVLKDGFQFVDCLKDYMWIHGDKFGSKNKANYEIGPNGVSIVHYEDHVSKAQQKPMSPQVCFVFCRTVPNMGFFGLINGRKCYCAPYYKSMASDSSQCDATCEGDATNTCGGKAKSSLFAMHACDDTQEELQGVMETSSKLQKSLDKKAKKASGLAKVFQQNGVQLRAVFGAVGDRAATDLAQTAKVFAGKLRVAAKEGEAASAAFGKVLPSAVEESKAKKVDVGKAEAIMKNLNKLLDSSSPVAKQLEEVVGLAKTSRASGAIAQYHPITSGAGTKGSRKTASTCNGKLVGDPMVVQSKDECANGCDAHVSACVGFQYFESPSKTCFLFSQIKAARHYTGCNAKAFLQVSSAPFETTCYVTPMGLARSDVETTQVKRCYGMAKAAKAMAAKAAAAKEKFKAAQKKVKAMRASLAKAKKVAAKKQQALKM